MVRYQRIKGTRSLQTKCVGTSVNHSGRHTAGLVEMPYETQSWRTSSSSRFIWVNRDSNLSSARMEYRVRQEWTTRLFWVNWPFMANLQGLRAISHRLSSWISAWMLWTMIGQIGASISASSKSLLVPTIMAWQQTRASFEQCWRDSPSSAISCLSSRPGLSWSNCEGF